MVGLRPPFSDEVGEMTSYRITDGVLAAIADRLAAVTPERGGALLAADGLVHLFVEDTHGDYTGSIPCSPATGDSGHPLGEPLGDERH